MICPFKDKISLDACASEYAKLVGSDFEMYVEALKIYSPEGISSERMAADSGMLPEER
jgi:hypothetical protein